jgi:hypothetical protein
MKFQRPRPFSIFLGCVVATLGALAFAQSSPTAKPKAEYKVVDDVSEGEANQLADDGWEYAGYLGHGVKGASNDQTLWKRAAK